MVWHSTVKLNGRGSVGCVGGTDRQRQTETDRQRQTETETERETERQKDRQVNEKKRERR